jgi:nucleoside-diphosphate-sugar epimerase
MKRILVTGARGFVGRHCLPLLQERGYEVHAVTSTGEDGVRDGVRWHRANLLTDPAGVVRDVEPTHLLHLAWITTPGAYWTSPENLDWVAASLALLRAFTGERAVLAGTCAEYDWSHGLCSERITPLQPATLYGECKRALQGVTEAYARQARLSIAWGRLFFLYGPDEHPARLVPSVARALLRGEEALCTSGDQIRDFLHVQDVAGAFVALLESEVTGPVNIASGTPVAVKDVIRGIAERTGRPDLLRLGARPMPAGEPPQLTADVRRLREEVGWTPGFSVDEGLDDTVAWWLAALKV